LSLHFVTVGQISQGKGWSFYHNFGRWWQW